MAPLLYIIERKVVFNKRMFANNCICNCCYHVDCKKYAKYAYFLFCLFNLLFLLPFIMNGLSSFLFYFIRKREYFFRHLFGFVNVAGEDI